MPRVRRLAEARTKEQWREYVLEPKVVPPRRPDTLAEYVGLDEEEQIPLRVDRRRYHSRLGVVTTPQMKRIHDELTLGMFTNENDEPGPSNGYIIDGHATLGKSTLVKRFGRSVELERRAEYPEEFEKPCHDYIPVVYVSVPAKASPKTLAQRFARFLAIPHGPNSTEAWLTDIVLETLDTCDTELVIIDDIHNLRPELSLGRAANTFLKDLQSHAAATFVSVGVNVDQTAYAAEGTSDFRTQTGGRSGHMRVEPFAQKLLAGKTTKAAVAEAEEWRRIVLSLENRFELYRHEPQSLAKTQWRYLLDRTSGRISTLSYLLRKAAIASILDGTERVDRALLDRTLGDWTAHRELDLRAQSGRGFITGRDRGVCAGGED